MFRKKYINFHIFETDEPCTLYVYSENGVLLAKKYKTTKSLSFCLAICSSIIKIIACFSNRTEYLCFYLGDAPRQKICVTFGSGIIYVQQIFLLDKNYNLPVKNAILNFSNKKGT